MVTTAAATPQKIHHKLQHSSCIFSELTAEATFSQHERHLNESTVKSLNLVFCCPCFLKGRRKTICCRDPNNKKIQNYLSFFFFTWQAANKLEKLGKCFLLLLFCTIFKWGVNWWIKCGVYWRGLLLNQNCHTSIYI